MPKKYTIDFDSPWELYQILKSINNIRLDILRKELGINDIESTDNIMFNSFETLGGVLLIDISKLTEEQVKYIGSDAYRKLENEQYKTLGVRVNDEKE